jgi:hypothetical protein
MQADMQFDAQRAIDMLREQLPRGMPYVVSTMLTRLAGRGRDQVKAAMPTAFDRPTPFTVRGVYIQRATNQSLSAAVFVPESQLERGKATSEYLRPGVFGTTSRQQKRTEYLLSRAGYLPPGWVTTPGYSVTDRIAALKNRSRDGGRGGGAGFAGFNYVDAYGNIFPSIYKQIVNVLQIKRAVDDRARGISQASQKRAKRMKVANEWFAVAPGTKVRSPTGRKLKPGVYRHVGPGGRQLQQVLRFVDRASYKKLLDFNEIVQKEVNRNIEQEFNAAWQLIRQRFAARGQP